MGIGLYATALWLIGRDGALAELASPEKDRGALEMNVRDAVELGKSRAKASAEARLSREEKRIGIAKRKFDVPDDIVSMGDDVRKHIAR
ncbi:hypothetical protein [Burkholderia pseudomallei]|uniref:hypothetical protein n=1 Tax=Burkholderia pseudomallei TaxID=28450 RepID=UPI001E329C7D|nr:hypothetical protein [Burkholderia pseudomallei]